MSRFRLLLYWEFWVRLSNVFPYNINYGTLTESSFCIPLCMVWQKDIPQPYHMLMLNPSGPFIPSNLLANLLEISAKQIHSLEDFRWETLQWLNQQEFDQQIEY